MAGENQLWGAERIRGELLKLGIEVSKRTIQRYMPKERKEHSSSHIVPMPLRDNWATFLKNQAGNLWQLESSQPKSKAANVTQLAMDKMKVVIFKG